MSQTLPLPFRRFPPLVAGATTFLHGKACHWIFGSFRSPTNPVPLPPPIQGALWVLGRGGQPFFPSGHRLSRLVSPRRTGRVYGFPSSLAHQLTSPLAHYRGFIKTGASGAHHNPLNPLNLLNLLNPHAQRACPKSRSAALPMHSFFLIFQMLVYLSA